ncbi:hypothetical protein ACH5RR_024284 [Cinchona calisaya]|uniref:FLZ-type domain-containing protein n=1 Tax=Cinchona calisaya TaxID=153742 RepID=A0ABD2YZD7_9GENT
MGSSSASHPSSFFLSFFLTTSVLSLLFGIKMLSKVSFRRPSKLNQKGDYYEIIKKRSPSVNMRSSLKYLDSSTSSSSSSSTAVGLRILTADSQASETGRSNNIVTNSDLKLIKPVFRMNQQSHYSSSSCSPDSCFLKSCFLCNKTLSLDKDVYMYRGDQGFCSVECRSRQIYLDEMKEIEKSTKQTLASFRRCRQETNNWCDSETKYLSEEFRQRHRPEQPKGYLVHKRPLVLLPE